MNLERISKEIIKQNEEIELFRDDDVAGLVQMILCEVYELAEAVEIGFITDDLTNISLEVADVQYLLIRLFDMLGIDERVVDIKIKRNYEKFSGYTDKQQARDDWAKQGGDKAFMERYIDNLED